uniref:Uncharacterized protein n=1 Tax=Arundo donax TaxID=35708 RepID=A0A0A9DLZ6_ARUDO
MIYISRYYHSCPPFLRINRTYACLVRFSLTNLMTLRYPFLWN